jgi:MSHA biogenesis protein MshP
MFPERRHSGFSVVAAIFLLVVLAVLAVIIASVTGIQQASSQLDVLAVRAYHAARTGMEWGAWQVLDPNNNLNGADCTSGPGAGPVMSDCPAPATNLPALAGSLQPFAVTVTCTRVSATEGNRDIRVFNVVATACNQPDGGGACPGPATNADYVERQLQASFSKCWDRTAAAPRCACG